MATCHRIVLAAWMAVALAGCGTVQVRGVGTDTGQPAYDLSGPSLGALRTQAERLCPQGHAVLRQWQRGNAAAGDSDPMTDWLLATAALSYDLQPAQAQMSIVCRA